MKNAIVLSTMIFSFFICKAQQKTVQGDTTRTPPKVATLGADFEPLIVLKDVKANVGKYVWVSEVVYAHRILDTVEVLAFGGVYPNVVLTVVITGRAFQFLKSQEVDNKTVSVNGEIVLYNGAYQLYLDDPRKIIVEKNKKKSKL